MPDQETLTALFDMSYGIYVVSSIDGEKMNGQLTNSVMQVTAEPAKMAAVVHKNNLTHEYIKKSGVYTVSTLAEGAPMTFIGLFGFKSGRTVDKFAQAKFIKGVIGAPLVAEYTISAFEVKVTQPIDVGTHTMFVGEIINGKILGEGRPLTYDYYYRVMKGKTPRNATTYKAPEDLKKTKE